MTANTDGKLTAKELLLAFNEIQKRGSKQDDNYSLGQLTGQVSHDGYTVTIRDENAYATVGFHNTVHVDANSSNALDHFMDKVHRVVAMAK